MYLPPLRQFYRAAESVVTLSREVWNRLCQTVEDHHKAIVANRIVAFQGGTISEGPTGTVLRVDAAVGPQTFQVAALPAYNSSSSQVDAWAICSPVNSSGGVNTSFNIACGLCVPHSVGDNINAEKVPYQVFGLGYQLSNGSTGVAMNVSGSIPITMQEVGQIGTPIRVAVVNGSTGTCNVASGSYATQQYDIYNNESSSIKLASNVAVTKHRIWPGKVTAATHGDIKLNESGNWVLLTVEEYAPSVNIC